jgi:DNA ligase-1
VRFAELVAISDAVARTGSRLAKVAELSSFLQRVPVDEIEIAVAFLSGAPRQGRIGLGEAALRAASAARAAGTAVVELADVDRAFADIKAAAGGGAAGARGAALQRLAGRLTASERHFLVRLLAGELRQGALEGVLVDAVARAAGVPPALVRRAAMLAGALPQVARAAIAEGAAGLSRVLLQPFQPVQPMLADTAASLDEALEWMGEATLEYKLDGARIQLHKVEDEVRVYSRGLRDVTIAVPEAVALARTLPARELILDGEVLALGPDGAPKPFQITMRRFGRKLDVDRLREELPLTPFFFDALYIDGQPLLDEPLARRAAVLHERLPSGNVVPRIVTADREQAASFARQALEAGHEGIMIKSLSAAYSAGRRGSLWLKVKQAHTLDLVVLAAEWGSGRRRGTLSNLHLGARDDRPGGAGQFVMLGKTFKGLTDAMLAWQTDRLLELEIGREGHIVHVRPELVVEIAFNDLQASAQYPGALALRFARVKRYRTDKTAAQADAFSTVRGIYDRSIRSG